MAIIRSNILILDNIYEMCVEWHGTVAPGQFFMLRAWDKDPLLSRPISVNDYRTGVLTFLYQAVGRGTALLSKLKPGDTLELQGPYGNGFPDIPGDLVLVGGGIGTAPLLYTAMCHRLKYPDSRIRTYLGFREHAYQKTAFEMISDELTINSGGIITDQVAIRPGETILTCGPEIMMHALCQIVPEEHPVYLSLENRMACGMGVCLGCSIATPTGNKRVCKEGPVFERKELGL